MFKIKTILDKRLQLKIEKQIRKNKKVKSLLRHHPFSTSA